MIKFITTENAVVENIKRFNRELETSTDLQDRLGTFRAWYAINKNGAWMFGPSKFIGYQDLTAEKYLEFHNQGMDGRRTEAIIGKWFEQVPTDSPLYSELANVLANYGKTPSKLARISIVSEAADQSANLVDLLTAVIRGLNDEERAELKRRI